MSTAHPNTMQADRDAIEDLGLADLVDLVGIDPYVVHVDEQVAS